MTRPHANTVRLSISQVPAQVNPDGNADQASLGLGINILLIKMIDEAVMGQWAQSLS